MQAFPEGLSSVQLSLCYINYLPKNILRFLANIYIDVSSFYECTRQKKI